MFHTFSLTLLSFCVTNFIFVENEMSNFCGYLSSLAPHTHTHTNMRFIVYNLHLHNCNLINCAYSMNDFLFTSFMHNIHFVGVCVWVCIRIINRCGPRFLSIPFMTNIVFHSFLLWSGGISFFVCVHTLLIEFYLLYTYKLLVICEV